MRLLFYNDPRSLICHLVYAITDGTMKIDEERFTFLKRYLNSCGQKELAKCMKADFYDR